MNADKPTPLATAAAPSTRGIAWTDVTWNALIGCTRVSAECLHCYAERRALRIVRQSAGRGVDTPYRNVVRKVGGEARWNGVVRRASDATFLKMRKFRRRAKRAARGEVLRLRMFVNSMSDPFHPDAVASGLTRAVFDELLANPGHDYQILTKRPEEAAKYYASDQRLHNRPDIWLGVSVGSAAAKGRIDILRTIPAARRFLSLEPVLEPLGDLDLTGIDWVIAGGESGPNARPCDREWLREIRNQCTAAKVPLFLKQLGGHPDKRAHEKAVLDGRTWTEFPPPLAAPPRGLPLAKEPAPDGRHCEGKKKRASLPVPIDLAQPPGGGNDRVGPHRERLIAAYDKLRKREERSLRDIVELGREWLAAGDAIAASGLDPDAWCERFMPFGKKLADNCAKIFREHNEVVEADFWYCSVGMDAGVRLNRHSGPDYWIEVTRAWRARDQPPKPTRKDREKARRVDAAALEERAEAAEERATRAEAERDRYRAERDTYRAELERVVRLYQNTKEGFDFRSDVLEAARREPAEAERLVPPFEAWRAARSRSGGDEGGEEDGD